MMAYIEREVTSRRAKRAAEHAEDFADEPVGLIREEEIVDGEDGVGVAGGFDEPEAEVEFVGAEVEDGVVEFAGQLQRPPIRACGEADSMECCVARFGRADGERYGARVAIELGVDVFVVDAGVVDSAIERSERDAFCVGGAVALLG